MKLRRSNEIHNRKFSQKYSRMTYIFENCVALNNPESLTRNTVLYCHHFYFLSIFFHHHWIQYTLKHLWTVYDFKNILGLWKLTLVATHRFMHVFHLLIVVYIGLCRNLLDFFFPLSTYKRFNLKSVNWCIRYAKQFFIALFC